MSGMGPPRRGFTKEVFVRTTSSVKARPDSVLADLRGLDSLHLEGQKTLSQEALISASWLWMRDYADKHGIERLEEELRPHVEQLDVILDEVSGEAAQKELRQAARQSRVHKEVATEEGVTHPAAEGHLGIL